MKRRIRKAINQRFVVFLHSWAVKVEIQTYFIFMLVVRAHVSMRLHHLTGNGLLVPFLKRTSRYKVDSHFSP